MSYRTTTYKDEGRLAHMLLSHNRIVLPCLISFMLMLSENAFCQKQTVYQFAGVQTSARAAAMGGTPVAIAEPDLGLASTNPAFLSLLKDSKIAADYVNYVSDISIGHVSYCFTDKKIPGTLAVGLQYLNGGENTRYDKDGNEAGDFSSNEFAINLSYARQFDSAFSIGATVKPVLSYIGGYSSIGLLADISANYVANDNRTALSLLVRNAGSQLTAYYDEYGRVPFDIQMAISHQLEHAPFRISFVLQSLQKFKLEPSKNNSAEQGSEVKHDKNTAPSFINNTLRHCVFGVELFPGKAFNIRAGYNFKRRQELKLDNAGGLSGISLGFGLKLKRFSVEYAMAKYTLSGTSNHFSLMINLPQ